MAAVLVWFSLVARLAAQWYAPATEYHDPVQRVFPVELARVLAARENAAGANVELSDADFAELDTQGKAQAR